MKEKKYSLRQNENHSNGKMFSEKVENVWKPKLILKTLRREGLGLGRENGEKARKIYGRKETREGMKFGLVLIYVNWQINP